MQGKNTNNSFSLLKYKYLAIRMCRFFFYWKTRQKYSLKMICAVLKKQRKCTFVHLHCCTVYTQNICLSRVSEDNSNWPGHAIVPTNTFFPLELVAPQVQSKPISQSVDFVASVTQHTGRCHAARRCTCNIQIKPQRSHKSTGLFWHMK